MVRKVMYALLIVACAALFLLLYAVTRPGGTSTAASTRASTAHTVQIGGETLRVTIADTEATRERGLSGRTGLADDEGMLFVFPKDGTYAFWMKEMNFSIDIIWISAGGRIVYIAPSVSPATYPEDFVPPTPARYVLEVPAGFAQTHEVKIGDIVGL